MGTSAICLRELHRRFGDIVAVQSLSLEIAEGEFFSLIGPSGCGKTTTLRMIAGLEFPTSGTIELRGKDISHEPPYRRPVNTVFQNYALFPHLDVFENVAFGLRERKTAKSEIKSRVERLLKLVDLESRMHHKPRLLSGGQQQRVALARALVLEPEVLLLDEPLGALDLKLRKSMQVLLREIQREVGITFIYVTHDQEEAFSMSTRVGVMSGGALEQVGVPREVYQRPTSTFVADFVGASNHLQVSIREVIGADRYIVDLNGQSVESAGPVGLTVGTQAALVVRPESIAIGAAPECAIVLDGSVADSSYSGPHEELTIATTVGQIRGALRGDVDLKIGDRMQLSWMPTGSWLVPLDRSIATSATTASQGEVGEVPSHDDVSMSSSG